MICTEDEAKTKFCPLVAQGMLAGNPFNGQPYCIGSACMAWRWQATVLGLRKGFCGLAGRPE